MNASLIRRTGAITLIAAAAAASLAGCDRGLSAKLTYDDTEKVKVTDIVVSGSSGDVSVKTAAITETRIKRIVRTDGRDPGQSYSITGSTLKVDTSCGMSCRVSYEIEAPAGVKVTGELHSGNISLVDVGTADVSVNSGEIYLQRIAGAVKAESTSGSITAHALSGPATLNTTSGNVEGLELTGGKPITAEARSGNVELHLVQPASVTANASSGNVELLVPTGSYRFRSEVGSGEVESNLTNSPAATNSISVTTGSGNIKVTTF
ncbi:hypothetical protein GCM10010435_34700 [Winogradskya consettensis]|uniref:DUF4097 domain-containing protein n=1 Tax=Winogradskya consettensis TaxID=113560 RepID=A0A919VS30_9ACTN|nr:DUF4097 family beta strand repeat-containing protein [Actinoplanes consettensis]GIM74381.1 hypothetical protein Aco04nite_40020 [Actinoplanes consettensis]